MSGILQESWLGEMVAGWDSIRKLNALEDHYLNWIVLLRDARNERNGAGNEILSFAFLLFLYDNASQKLGIPLHFSKCEPLICTLEPFYH